MNLSNDDDREICLTNYCDVMGCSHSWWFTGSDFDSGLKSFAYSMYNVQPSATYSGFDLTDVMEERFEIRTLHTDSSSCEDKRFELRIIIREQQISSLIYLIFLLKNDSWQQPTESCLGEPHSFHRDKQDTEYLTYRYSAYVPVLRFRTTDVSRSHCP